MGFFSGFNINMLIHQQQTNSKQEQAESSRNHPKQANQPEPTPNLPENLPESSRINPRQAESTWIKLNQANQPESSESTRNNPNQPESTRIHPKHKLLAFSSWFGLFQVLVKFIVWFGLDSGLFRFFPSKSEVFRWIKPKHPESSRNNPNQVKTAKNMCFGWIQFVSALFQKP